MIPILRHVRNLARLRRPTKGASLAEYGLVVGLVAVVAIAAVSSTGRYVEDVFCELGVTLSNIGPNPSDELCADGEAGGWWQPAIRPDEVKISDLEVLASTLDRDIDIRLRIGDAVASVGFAMTDSAGSTFDVGVIDRHNEFQSLTLMVPEEAAPGTLTLVASPTLRNGNTGIRAEADLPLIDNRQMLAEVRESVWHAEYWAHLQEAIRSTEFQVRGLDRPMHAEIRLDTGSGYEFYPDGVIEVNGTPVGPTATIGADDRVQMVMQASDQYRHQTSAALFIDGEIMAQVSAQTLSGQARPFAESPSLENVDDAAPNAEVRSNILTVSGVAAGTQITAIPLSGGEVKLRANGGEWVDTLVATGTTLDLQLRTTAPTSGNASVLALSISGQMKYWLVAAK